jgi:2-iminobutanoate/2-iminopropanoate deaminase
MRPVYTENAPKAIGPYVQAIICGELVFTSGQIPICASTGEIIGEDITTQTQQVMENLSSIVKTSGASMDTIVKTTCYLSSMDDFNEFNTVYASFFQNFPARSCIVVRTLPKGVLVEVEAIAKIHAD